MPAQITIGNFCSYDSGAKKIAKLNALFAGSYLKPTFGLAPIGGSFDLCATTLDEHLAERAANVGQTADEFFRDSLLQSIMHAL